MFVANIDNLGASVDLCILFLQYLMLFFQINLILNCESTINFDV